MPVIRFTYSIAGFNDIFTIHNIFELKVLADIRIISILLDQFIGTGFFPCQLR